MDTRIAKINMNDKGRSFLKFFLRFLKENHCFGKYQRALFERSNYRANDFIKKECENCNYGIIDHSFIWSDTKEGHRYWCNLNNEFRSLYFLSIKKQ